MQESRTVEKDIVQLQFISSTFDRMMRKDTYTGREGGKNERKRAIAGERENR